MRTPPGLSSEEFEKAIVEFRAVVGDDWVFTEEADVNLYRDAYSVVWNQEDERVASAAVCPDSTEQVQQVVRIANAYLIPIYPISTGRNLGYGGSAPNYSGSVVIDLKRMNRILEVDERNHSVLVEPGVSYFDMYKHLRDTKSGLWVDVPDPGWGSLIGNALDHGNGYLQPTYRNHFDSHCGMEVVLPNGEVMRTGMGALPGSETWQNFKLGVGPHVDGLFAQSNFGIVTKMGFWMMPEPDAYFSGKVMVSEYEDLIPLIDITNYLENSGVVNGMPFFGSPVYGGFLSYRDPSVMEFLEADKTDDELRRFVKSKNIHMWEVSLRFYGPEKAIKESWEYCKTKFAEKIPNAKFEDLESWKLPLSDEDIKEVTHKPVFGVPSLEMFLRGARSKANPEPDWGHIWFTPIIPRTGEAVFKANKIISEILDKYGIIDSRRRTKFTMPSTYWNRSFILLYGFAITRDPEKDQNTREGIQTLIRESAKHGWGEYRAAPAIQETVVEQYSFNDHALLRFQETLKDAVDPKGIMSPGRYGIWPQRLRKERK